VRIQVRERFSPTAKGMRISSSVQEETVATRSLPAKESPGSVGKLEKPS
jgi:hypothetical protein